MRILFLCNEYPPSVHGGIGSFTRDIAEGMVYAGHHVTVWGLYSDIHQSKRESINGVEVIRFRYKKLNSRINQAAFLFFFNFYLRKFLKSAKIFDFVECQEWQGLLPFGLPHPTLVIRLHGAATFFDSLLNRPSSRLTTWAERRTIKSAKHLVAVSKYCGEKTLEILGIHKSFRVIYNAIKTDKIAKHQKNELFQYRILFTNSLLPKKGVFELADAFNQIAAKYPKSELYFIGKTGYSSGGKNIRDLILERVDPQFKDRIKVLGWLNSREEVFEWLSSAHLCVYPSHMEGFGIAPVESMALAKPTIFMKSGPGPEVIEDCVSGLLVDTKDPYSIFEAVDRIFSDSNFGRTLGMEAQKRAIQLFDLETVFIPENVSYYKSLIPA